MIQNTLDTSRSGTPRPATAASQAPSVLSGNQVSLHMDNTEDNIRDDDAGNDDDDDEIEEVMEMNEIGSDTGDARPTASAAASRVSEAHLCIQALQFRN